MVKHLLLVVLFFIFSHSSVLASVPERINQEHLLDVTMIENPEEEHFFYGDLQSFPHTFQISSEETFDLYVEVRVPDIENADTNVSGIVVRERDKGGVVEIKRLHADEGEWSQVRETLDGNTYLAGPSFEDTVDPGVYRIEVSTPDNIEKYVLVVGKSKSTENLRFAEKVKRIADTKVFFGKSKIMAVQSPVIYKPLMFLLILFGVGYIMYRKKRSNAL